ncbi:MAG: phosphoribosylaminoimidazolesuccinocarboxamide synthase, partial [Candidatus Margulisiibacteriota bacterium]
MKNESEPAIHGGRLWLKKVASRFIEVSMKNLPILEVELPGIPLLKKGKVRNVFDLGNLLLLVASDRISAFDVIMPNGIPDKGKILTQISLFWFNFTKNIVPNHVVTAKIDEYPSPLQKYRQLLEKRSMLGKKAKVIPIECVVRGYLSGSGWKEYRDTQSICGIKLPAGLRESEKLPEPIFTPSIKAETG